MQLWCMTDLNDHAIQSTLYMCMCMCMCMCMHMYMCYYEVNLLDSTSVAQSDSDDLALSTQHLTKIQLATRELHAGSSHFSR